MQYKWFYPVSFSLFLWEYKYSGHLNQRGAVVNKDDGTGNPALYLACILRHDEIALALVENGAEVNSHDKKGRTSLYYTMLLRMENRTYFNFDGT